MLPGQAHALALGDGRERERGGEVVVLDEDAFRKAQKATMRMLVRKHGKAAVSPDDGSDSDSERECALLPQREREKKEIRG